jgi:hypothetical protein
MTYKQVYCHKCKMYYNENKSYQNHCCECKINYYNYENHCCKCIILYNKYNIIHCCECKLNYCIINQNHCCKCQLNYNKIFKNHCCLHKWNDIDTCNDCINHKKLNKIVMIELKYHPRNVAKFLEDNDIEYLDNM